MPRPGSPGQHPAQTPSYCVAGDYGTPEKPLALVRVNAHRSHGKTPRCQDPPMVRIDGEWRPATTARRVESQVLPTTFDPSPGPDPFAGAAPTPPPMFAPAAPPLEPPPPPPEVVPSAPRFPTGKAVITTPSTSDGSTPVPLFTPQKPPALSSAVFQLFDWICQQGYTGDFESFCEQAIRGYMFFRFRKASAIVDVDDETYARALAGAA